MKILQTSPERETLAKTATALVAWAGRLDLPQDVRADLRDLANRLRPNREPSKESIVFTTTLTDPKSLITVGDLVKCSSCQNYRTGGIISTLPGYVIDANVQAVASFNLTAGVFIRPAEFETVKQAIRDGKNVKTVWDGGKRTVTFEIPSAEGQASFVTTKSVDQAYRRHMVKLGQTADGDAGIYFEGAYTSSIETQGLMERQVESLKHEMAAAIGGHHDKRIKVKASRNPGGHYSDGASGIKKTDYDVGP